MSKITKKQLQRDIELLESGISMNWSDMKKIETKISRAMTDMATRISNISLQLEGQQRQIHLAADSIGLNKQAIIMLENKAEPKPQLKQLDQSVFDGLDEKWRFAAVVADDRALYFDKRPYDSDDTTGHFVFTGDYEASFCGTGYDASNWQNSLIERDLAKELLEVDLSSELTGSDLCVAMLLRLDEYVMCMTDDGVDVIHDLACLVSSTHPFIGRLDNYKKVTPINNQGEPLTAADVGL